MQTTTENTTATITLSQQIHATVMRYLQDTAGQEPNRVYDFVMEEVEVPLIKAVMDFTRDNQSRTARILGISRGTLRTKLQQYFGDKYIRTRDAA